MLCYSGCVDVDELSSLLSEELLVLLLMSASMIAAISSSVGHLLGTLRIPFPPRHRDQRSLILRARARNFIDHHQLLLALRPQTGMEYRDAQPKPRLPLCARWTFCV